MNTKSYTDQELIMAFSNMKPVQSKTYNVQYKNLIAKTFFASNKTEALRIAREYGARIIGDTVLAVYEETN